MVDSLRTLGTNIILHGLFALLATYKLGLHLLDDESLPAVNSGPLELVIMIQHEPAELTDLLRLFNDDAQAIGQSKKQLIGIPQIVAVSSRREEDMKPSSIELWRSTRSRPVYPTPNVELPTVVLHIVQIAAGPGDGFVLTPMSSGIKILERDVSYAKHPEELPFRGFPTPSGDSATDVGNAVQYVVHLHPLHCIDGHWLWAYICRFINEYIRLDVENRFRLRIKLSKLEKILFSLASVSFLEDGTISAAPLVQELFERALTCEGGRPVLDPACLVFIEMLLKKIARERVYRLAINDSDSTRKLDARGRELLMQHFASDTGRQVPEVWSEVLKGC